MTFIINIMENKKWFIPGNVPSSKNGRRWTGKYFIASKAVMDYRKIAKDYYTKYEEEFKAELAKHLLPANISFTFGFSNILGKGFGFLDN